MYENLTFSEIFSVVYDWENQGINLYKNCDDDDVLKQILTIKQSGLNLLLQEKKRLEGVLGDDFNVQIQGVKNQPLQEKLDDRIIEIIAYENDLCNLYQTLTKKEFDSQTKDIFFRLWATSYNEYIPTLKSYLVSIYAQDIKVQESAPNAEMKSDFLKNLGIDMDNSMKEFLDKAKKVVEQKASKEEIAGLLQNPNFSFFSGLAVGGLAGVAIKELLENDINSNKG